MPVIPMRSALHLSAVLLCACAQTVNVGSDASTEGDAQADLSDGRGVADSADGRPAECTRTDWRCADLIDSQGGVVWVDQDISLPDVRPVYWELNRLRYGVRLSPFRIGRYEVTNEAYQACVQAGACPPSEPPAPRDPPVVPQGYATTAGYRFHPALVNWFEGLAVCRFLGGDLPTKAEWQFAAHGGTSRRFPWGNDLRCVGNFQVLQIVLPPEERLECGDGRGSPRTLPVDSSPDARGPSGTFNLLGNVGEVVYSDVANDWNVRIREQNDVGQYPLDPPPPMDSATGLRVGGGWLSASPISFAAISVSTQPSERPVADLGVRCVWRAR